MLNKNYIIIGILIILLGSLTYIGYDKYKEKQIEVYQQGLNDGRDLTISNLIEVAITCQQIPLTFQNNNQTQKVNLIALECIQEKWNK